jgi:hypothetical protein
MGNGNESGTVGGLFARKGMILIWIFNTYIRLWYIYRSHTPAKGAVSFPIHNPVQFPASYIGYGWASSLHLQAVWHTSQQQSHIPISYLFPKEFRIVQLWIFEPVRLRLFGRFQVEVLFNVLLSLLFERQTNKTETVCL